MTPAPRPMTRTGHVLQVGDAGVDRLRALLDWTLEGVRRDEKVVLTTVDPTEADAVVRAFGEAGARPDQLEVWSARCFYPGAIEPAVLTAALEAGWRGLRLAGSAEAALKELPAEAYLAGEARLQQLCRELPVSTLCQYDVTQPAQLVRDAVSLHAVVADATMTFTATAPDRVRVDGAVDATNADLLTQSLRTHATGRGNELVVDLTATTLLGAAGARALLEGTRERRAAGVRLRLVVDNDVVARVLDVLEVESAPGIRLERRRAWR